MSPDEGVACAAWKPEGAGHAQRTGAADPGLLNKEDAVANWITLARFPILAANGLLLYLGSPGARLAGVGLLLLGLLLDTVDGIVARRRGESSLFGSVLDIAADRTYELVLWVCFADLRLVPTALPLIVLVRTTLTDAVRAVGARQGAAPFAQSRGRLGRFLVASAWSRTGYSMAKIVAFCGLAFIHAAGDVPTGTLVSRVGEALAGPVRIVAWTAVMLCVLRGLPVLVAMRRQLAGGALGTTEGAPA
jgi:phosphatidylglycerophosphate synthase